MNGYELTRAYFDFAYENPDLITPNETALYMWLIEKCNRCGWVKKLSITSSENMAACGFSTYPPYKKAFDKLVQLGFITILVQAKNQYQTNIIALSKNDNATEKALDKAHLNQSTKQVESNQESTFNINKTSNNKPQTTNNKKGEASSPYYSLFVKSYFDFFKTRVGVDPRFSKSQGKAIKEIIEYLTNQSKTKTEEGGLESWNYILTSWNTLPEFYQSQINPEQILKFINNILSELKKEKSSAKKENATDKALRLHNEMQKNGNTPEYDENGNFIIKSQY